MRSATVLFAVFGASLAAFGPSCKTQSADTDDEVIDELRQELRDVRDELRDVRAELRDLRPRLADLEKLGTVEPAEATGPATAVATPTPGAAAPPATPAQAGPIRVEIKSRPKGARVFLDKRYLGKTPLLYQHPGVVKGLELRIERGGYNPHLRSLDLERDTKLSVTLTRIKRTAPEKSDKLE